MPLTVDEKALTILKAIDSFKDATFEDLDATVDAVGKALGTIVTRNQGEHRMVHLRFLTAFFEE
jgi:hypothetical protein